MSDEIKNNSVVEIDYCKDVIKYYNDGSKIDVKICVEYNYSDGDEVIITRKEN